MINVERTMGSKYPISIGTSIALEGLFGILEGNSVPSSKAPWRSYQCFLVNLKTLVRNYLSSYKVSDLTTVSYPVMYNDFLGELVLIKNIIEEQSDGRMQYAVYYNTHERITRHLKRPNLKTKFTAKQEFNLTLETRLCDGVNSYVKTNPTLIPYEFTTDTITNGARHNVILTHLPVDLLLTALHCDLIESHTGKIKPPHLFPTKLKTKGQHIPFNKYTIQIYGDSSGNILSQSSKIKDELTKLCTDLGYTAVTSERRFYKGIRKRASSELASLISTMK